MRDLHKGPTPTGSSVSPSRSANKSANATNAQIYCNGRGSCAGDLFGWQMSADGPTRWTHDFTGGPECAGQLSCNSRIAGTNQCRFCRHSAGTDYVLTASGHPGAGESRDEKQRIRDAVAAKRPTRHFGTRDRKQQSRFGLGEFHRGAGFLGAVRFWSPAGECVDCGCREGEVRGRIKEDAV
jgi:hypothetical protein